MDKKNKKGEKMKAKLNLTVIIIVLVFIAVSIFMPIISAKTVEEWEEECVDLLNSGEFEKSIECFNKSIEQYPNYSDAYNNRGVAYSRLNQYERAIQDYNKALELNPNGSTTYFNRGLNYVDLKQYEIAIEDYNKSLELNPNYTTAYNFRGVAYSRLNQYERAIQDFSKSLELNPDYKLARDNQIHTQLTILVESINNGNTGRILGLISPNARAGLKEEIDNNLRGKQISYQMEITSFEELDNNKVKVKGRFAASGIGWDISGLSNYFIFEPVNSNWSIVDTDFHGKLGPEAVFRFVGTIFLVLIPLFGFWLWMLVDCAKRDIENKTAWILILIFLSILGAILYYFIVRRKYKKRTIEKKED